MREAASAVARSALGAAGQQVSNMIAPADFRLMGRQTEATKGSGVDVVRPWHCAERIFYVASSRGW